MRIAICDDDPRDLDQMKGLIADYYLPSQTRIDSFSSAAELYEAARALRYDIVILDIEMEKPNGYEIAQKLIAQKPKPLIIFVTNSMEYTVRGYGVAFRYLPKPIDKGYLWDALDAAVREVTANRFVFCVDTASHVLHLEEIYYFEVFNHHTVLHTADGAFAFRATLREVLTQLPAGYFGMPHQSYIVSFAHIKTATSREIHLTNGACVPISRRRQKAFDEQFHLYLRRS